MATITQLQYILAVHKLKHFGRAALQCNVSQPSLSAQIQKVEDELDLIIFDRSKKPIMETDLGKQFIAQAKVIVEEHKKLLSLKSDGDEVSGSFHLGVIPTLSAYVIPLFVESFSEKYPKVELTISEYKTQDIVSMLTDDELDGGLLVTPLYDDKMIERSLFFEPFYAFLSDDHPLIGRKIIEESELESSNVWLLDEGHCFRDQVIKVCSSEKESKVLPNIKFQSGNFETLMNLIRRSKGYTLIPYLATETLSDKERSRRLKKFKPPVPTREISLVHSRSFLKENILQALQDEILNSAPKNLKSLKRAQVEVIDI